MINASVLSSLLSKRFSQSSRSINDNFSIPSYRNNRLTNHLAELLNSIIDSESDSNFNDMGDDGALLQKFSLDYMKQVIEYYDEKDPLTGKPCRS